MTREEFFQNVTDLSDLSSICYDYDYYEFDDRFYTGDRLFEWYDDLAEDILRNDGWYDLKTAMEYWDTSEDWYYMSDYGEPRPATEEDFIEFRDEVFQSLVENGDIEDPDEDESEDETIVDEDTPDVPEFEDEPDFSVEEMFAFCAGTCAGIQNNRKEESATENVEGEEPSFFDEPEDEGFEESDINIEDMYE